MKARGPIEAEEARSRWSRLAKSPTVPTTHQFTELAMQTVLRTLPAQAYRRIFEMAGLIDSPTAGDRHTSGHGYESSYTAKHRPSAATAREATTSEQWTSEQWSDAPG